MVARLPKFKAGMIGVALLFGTASAQAASLTVIHGITGGDLGLDPALPVDIALNGDCALQGAEFGAITDPLEIDAGLYDVEIRLAEATPCTGPLAIAAQISIAFAEDASVIAHLTPEGTITATKFSNDVRATAPGGARVVVRHTADAPAVDVFARKIFSHQSGDGGRDRRGVLALGRGLQNSEQAKADVESGTYRVVVTPANEATVVLGPAELALTASEASFVYAVGSLPGDSLTLLIQTTVLEP